LAGLVACFCIVNDKHKAPPGIYIEPKTNKEIDMESHVFQTKICKRGYLELKNLPFKEGTVIEISISKKERKKNLQNLITNDHVWSNEDIKAIERGREIINKWKIS
jgi:uncharacterized 2Fe-2S/4Fe-4S cluster protein (DUF4445 family)